MKAVKAFGRGVVRARIPILIAALLLLIPAVYGMRHTRINYDMLDYLPEVQREVIIMRFYEDLSFKEIAEKTGVSINTSLGRMRYALINLRKLIQQHNVALVG